MGHRHKSAPNRGSLGFRPKARAQRISGRWRAQGGSTWIDELKEPTLTGFPSYKTGMTHVIKIEERKRNRHYKQEKSIAVTILEIPKTVLYGVRAYQQGYFGKEVLTEVWHHKLDKNVSRKLSVPSETYTDDNVNQKIDMMKEQTNKIIEVRALVYTLPLESGTNQKKPDIMEIKIGGKEITKNLDWALEHLGKEIKINEFFKEGEYIDVSSVTKGKGFQGPVKRHGIKILPRKTRKGRRVVGAIGSWHPARVSWTTPRAGGMGFHNRTEYHKKILKVSENPREINPAGGFKHYGLVKGTYILVEGSVPGSSKRLVRVRKSVRKTPKEFPESDPVRLSYVSIKFHQSADTEEEGI
ncbi:MAG: 50S ribosomal protein L3 [Candidatus Hodarchaeales archaeon]|jgi:large subunit ribosomal protein L3